jgi:hypothetical protein
MSEKKTTIVVRLHANHPSGQRYRAWFKFWLNPLEVEVTDAELKMIQEDSFLIIVKAWTALSQATKAWKHVAKEPTAEGASDTKTIDDFTKKEIIAKLEEMWIATTGRETKEVLRSMMNWTAEAKATDHSLLSVEEIIAKLEEKWLKEWTDFNASADKQSLIELLLA